jgi:hypothetical protein
MCQNLERNVLSLAIFGLCVCVCVCVRARACDGPFLVANLTHLKYSAVFRTRSSTAEFITDLRGTVLVLSDEELLA